MTITDYILSSTARLVKEPEVTPHPPGYSMFNSGSTEVEVAEFLYSLVKLVKPDRILETGTHAGVSAAYMAQGLSENGKGHLTTIEWDGSWKASADLLFADLHLQPFVDCLQMSSLDFDPAWAGHADGYDIIFLDSEPHLRFDEFVRYFPFLKRGGFVMIHDLHPHLGHTDTTVNDMYDWPYGDFRQKLGPMIVAHEVQTINFRSPRGFTLFQRAAADFGAYNLLTGKI